MRSIHVVLAYSISPAAAAAAAKLWLINLQQPAAGAETRIYDLVEEGGWGGGIEV